MKFLTFYTEASKLQDYPPQLIKRAMEIFDVVDDVNLAEYILYDGTCLMVNNDHRIISSVFKQGIPKGYYSKSNSGYMLAFMGETDSIRVRTTQFGSFFHISLINPISYNQWNKIEKVSAKNIGVDWLSKEYDTLSSREFENNEFDMENLFEYLRNRP